jgi:hypothetical protein
MVTDISKNDFFNVSAKTSAEYLDWNRSALLASLRDQGKNAGLNIDEIGNLLGEQSRSGIPTDLNLKTKLYNELKDSIVLGKMDFLGIETLFDDFFNVSFKSVLEQQKSDYGIIDGELPYNNNDLKMDKVLTALRQEFDYRFWYEPMIASHDLLNQVLEAANLNPESARPDNSNPLEHHSVISAGNGVKYDIKLFTAELDFQEINRVALVDEVIVQLQEATPERILERNLMYPTKDNTERVLEASEYFMETAESLDQILMANGIDLSQKQNINQQKERNL